MNTVHILSRGYSNSQIDEVTTTTAAVADITFLNVSNNSVTSFITRITAIQSAGVGTGDVWVHELRGAIKNIGGTTTLVDVVTDESIAEEGTGLPAWSATAVANNTSDQLEIKVTGEVSKTIKWKAETIYNTVTY